MKNQLRSTLAAIASAAAMCAALPVLSLAAAPGDQQNFAGDLDRDGSVGVTDVILLQKYLVGLETMDPGAARVADVYADGVIDIFDLAKLKNLALNGSQGQQPTQPSTEVTQPTETTQTTETTEATQPTEATEATEAPTTNPDATGVVASIIYNGSSVQLLDANGAEIAPADASNVAVSGAYVTITKAGDYDVSGTSTNGQLKVSTDDTAEPTAQVTLSFTGLELSNSTAAPVYVENVGDEVVISVKKDTVNTISDGTTHTDTYTNSSGETKTCEAAIYARDDIKIKGKGTLTVNGNAADGIVSTNDVKIFNSTLIVNAADDGIRGDTVKIGDADDAVSVGGSGYDNLNVTVKAAAGDGIRAGSDNEGKGVVTINGGTVNINSYADGIQAEQEFVMNDGSLTIYTYQGSNFGGSGSSSSSQWGGGMGMDGNANKTDISAKGIKAVGLYDSTGTTYQSMGNITVNGGTINVDSSDDALHCGGDMYIYGGVFAVASADDAFHSDHSLTIGKTAANTFDDVQIYVSKCYEGVEGVNIIQNSGTVYIISGDDGYNAAGGADGSGTGNTNPWGGGGMSTSSGTLTLNGGLVVVNSASGDHDAFDSNGNFTVTGGYYCANGQEPLDYDGTFTNNGGTFITMQAGNTNLTTRYTFTDNSGNAVVSFFSAAGGGLKSGSAASAQSGGNISGGTTVLAQAGDKSVTVGGSLSGGSTLGQASESAGPGQGGPGQGGPGGW